MCAMDRRERVLIRQLHFPNDLRENISLLKYPVCIRFEDGSFIGTNHSFERFIKLSYCSCDEWFEHLTLESKLQLSRSEMDSYFSTYGVSYINNVSISAMSWSMVIETLNTNEGCFFVWRFIESNDKNISTSLISKSNDGLMFFSGEYIDIEPYLVGFSHYYSAAVTKISISKSKKKTMNFFKMNGFSSRDHWLDEMLRSEKILFLYDRVKGILKTKY